MRAKADGAKSLLTPVTEDGFEFQNINAFEYAVEGRLARGRTALEAEPPQPVVRVVAAPIRDGRLACASAHHSDAAKQEYRKKVITFTFSLPEIG